MLLGNLVNRARFLLLERVPPAIAQAPLLFLLADVQVVFENLNVRADEHVFERDNFLEKALSFGLGAETHHPFDTGTILPTAVE